MTPRPAGLFAGPTGLAFASLTLLLITLNPFRGSGTPSVQVVVMGWDIAQNLLLFLPLGAVARLVLGRWGVAVLFGLALSASIEGIQGFLAVRSANPVDVAVNGASTALGAGFGAVAMRSVPAQALALGLLFVPLGWVSAMRAAVEPLCAVTVLACAIGAMSAVRPDRRVGLAVGTLALAPLLVTAPWWGVGAASLVALAAVAPLPTPLLTVIGALVISLLLATPWTLLGESWPRYPSTHLRWIEPALLLGLGVLMVQVRRFR